MAFNPLDLIKRGTTGLIEQGKDFLKTSDKALVDIRSKIGSFVSPDYGYKELDKPSTAKLKTGETIRLPFNVPKKTTFKESLTVIPKYTTMLGTGFGRLGEMALGSTTPGKDKPDLERIGITPLINKIVQTKTGGLLADTFGKLEQYQQPKSLGEAQAMRNLDIGGIFTAGSTKNIANISRRIAATQDPNVIRAELRALKLADNTIEEYLPLLVKETDPKAASKIVSEAIIPPPLRQKAVELEIRRQALEESPFNRTTTATRYDKKTGTPIEYRTSDIKSLFTKEGDVKRLGDLKNVNDIRNYERIMAEVGFDDPEDFADALEKYQLQRKSLINDEKLFNKDVTRIKNTPQFKAPSPTPPKVTPKVIPESQLVERLKQYPDVIKKERVDSLVRKIEGTPNEDEIAEAITKFKKQYPKTEVSTADIISILKREAIKKAEAEIKKNIPTKINKANKRIDEQIAILSQKPNKTPEDFVRLNTLRKQRGADLPVATSEARSLQETAESLKYDNTTPSAIRKVNATREAEIRAFKDVLDLDDKDIKQILGRRDFRQMSEQEYTNLKKEILGKGQDIKDLKVQRQIVGQTLKDKEFKKVENLQKVMQLPTLKNMSISQLRQFDEAMQQFKQGDTFLTPKRIKALEGTDIAGVKTYGEVREAFAKSRGISVDELGEIPVRGLDRVTYDIALARRSPFHKEMVDSVHTALIEGEARFLEKKQLINDLIKDARKSRKRGISDLFVPTDKKIFDWLGSNPEDKARLATDMTSAELKAAEKIQEMFAEARDYLIQTQVLNKYRSNYITNIRRGFLESWKEDGLMKAFKEIFESNKVDEAFVDMIDKDTGQMLALNKFFKFSVARGNKIKPTKNVADAVTTYFGALEKKRAFDSIIPKIDTYAAALSDKNGALSKFTKEWLNTKKGNVTKFITTPGSKADWALKSGVALTRLLQLGFSLPAGAVSFIGEQVANVVAIGARRQALGALRLSTKRGRSIVSKYKNFIGESTLEKLTDASKNIGDSFATGAFGLFNESARLANAEGLLGMMTKDEYIKGVISPQRLQEIQAQMGRFRVTEKADSIIGATSGGKTFTQYKKWAVPILSSTIEDLGALGKTLKTMSPTELKKFVFSQQGAELRRIVTTSFLGFILYDYYASIKDKKNKTFVDEIATKAAREALTLMQGLSPSLWLSTPVLVKFIADIGMLADQIVTVEKNKEGEIKAIEKAKTMFTPSAIKQVIPPDTETKAEKLWNSIKDKSKEEKVAYLKQLEKLDPNMVEPLKQAILDDKLGTTQEEKEIRKLQVENNERATFIYNQIKMMGSKEEKVAYLQNLESKKVMSDKVSTQVKKMLSGELEPNVPKAEDKKLATAGINFIKALFVDPRNAVKSIGKEEIEDVQGNLVKLTRDFGEEYFIEDEYGVKKLNEKGGAAIKLKLAQKMGIPISDVQFVDDIELYREHIVPVSAGGDNSLDNQFLAGEDEHKSYTKWDTAAGKAVRDGRMTRKEVTEIAKKLKVDKSISVEQAIQMLK